MQTGTRRKRGDNEYIFIDGKAMRADEALRIDVGSQETSVPGQDASSEAPGQNEGKGKGKGSRRSSRGLRDGLRELGEDDGLGIRDEALEGDLPFTGVSALQQDDRRKMRRKYLISGIALLVLVIFSLCISTGYFGRIYSPFDVLASYYWRIRIMLAQVFDPANAMQMLSEAYERYPMLYDATASFFDVLKYLVCGVFLALSGMLYQNVFRNPIAAPSMLGVSNGVSIALLILVMVFGSSAAAMSGYYYLFSYIGGILVLVLVVAGGKFISGKGRFNVTNMLLVGTIVSQLCGVIVSYVQNNFMDESAWLVYYNLQSAVDVDSVYTYITLIVGGIVALLPVIVFRFQLNLVSFPDSESRLLGVDPNRLRTFALICGSLMILTAQVNAGQVSMLSLVIPFIVRAMYGAEFRKQLWGNIICGAFLMVLCYDISSYFYLSAYGITLGSIVSVVALPLFIWMIAARQRSWE